MLFQQVQRFILTKKVFWGQVHFNAPRTYDYISGLEKNCTLRYIERGCTTEKQSPRRFPLYYYSGFFVWRRKITWRRRGH